MLYRSLVSAAILAASISFSHAADDFAPIDDARMDWSGTYAGVQAGWAGADYYTVEVAPGPGPFGSFNGIGTNASGDFGGWLAGVHVGMRQQDGDLVVGLEGDLGWMDVSGTTGFLPAGQSIGEVGAGIYATARATAGVAVDTALLYVTGGGVLFNTDIGTADSLGAVTLDAVNNETLTGWVAGAGFEIQAPNNWSWKIEYLHMDFGDVVTGGPRSVAPNQVFNWRNELSVDTITLKLSKRM